MSATSTQQERRIIGLSLSPQLAGEVKAEAARRGISMRKLFEELWTKYEPPGSSEPSTKSDK